MFSTLKPHPMFWYFHCTCRDGRTNFWRGTPKNMVLCNKSISLLMKFGSRILLCLTSEYTSFSREALLGLRSHGTALKVFWYESSLYSEPRPRSSSNSNSNRSSLAFQHAWTRTRRHERSLRRTVQGTNNARRRVEMRLIFWFFILAPLVRME